jgi:hypothetical protein
MSQKLARHGSNAGYRAHLGAGNDPCARCHRAHLVYSTQYSKASRMQGIKYKGDQVIDHLYQSGARSEQSRSTASARTAGNQPEPGAYAPTEPTGSAPESPAEPAPGPSVADRLSAGFRNLVMPDGEPSPYVESDDPPEYLGNSGQIPFDPEPAGEEWTPVDDSEFVINAAGMQKIEENLGTYLSIIGMTAEMIDPYCGGIAANNFENMVGKWSKVVAHYPAAAKLFLDEKSGVLFTWIAALQSTWPVLAAIYHHHFARDIVVKDGTVYTRNQNGQGPVDATTPPMDSYTYSAA